MARPFASGKYAKAICDICGLTFKLKDLRPLVVKGRNTNLLACAKDWNEDHPQNRLGERRIDDPQALRNPRPEINNDTQSVGFGWGVGAWGLNSWGTSSLTQIMRDLP